MTPAMPNYPANDPTSFPTFSGIQDNKNVDAAVFDSIMNSQAQEYHQANPSLTYNQALAQAHVNFSNFILAKDPNNLQLQAAAKIDQAAYDAIYQNPNTTWQTARTDAQTAFDTFINKVSSSNSGQSPEAAAAAAGAGFTMPVNTTDSPEAAAAMAGSYVDISSSGNVADAMMGGSGTPDTSADASLASWPPVEDQTNSLPWG